MSQVLTGASAAGAFAAQAQDGLQQSLGFLSKYILSGVWDSPVAGRLA